jgi:hypothetical protein
VIKNNHSLRMMPTVLSDVQEASKKNNHRVTYMLYKELDSLTITCINEATY